MNSKVMSIHETIKLNTRLFHNLLQDVTNEIAYKVPTENTNPIMFITIHLLDARFYIARFCGVKFKNPYKEIFDKINSHEDMKGLPSIDEIRNTWDELSKKLLAELEVITDERLSQNPRLDFPVEDKTIFGAITFMTQHESYHLGQLGYLRKYFGLSPINYN